MKFYTEHILEQTEAAYEGEKGPDVPPPGKLGDFPPPWKN